MVQTKRTAVQFGTGWRTHNACLLSSVCYSDWCSHSRCVLSKLVALIDTGTPVAQGGTQALTKLSKQVHTFVRFKLAHHLKASCPAQA